MRFEDDGVKTTVNAAIAASPTTTTTNTTTPSGTTSSSSPFDALASSSSQSVNGYRGVLPGNTTLVRKNTSDIGEATASSSTNCSHSTTSSHAAGDFGGAAAAELGASPADGCTTASGGACRTRAFQRIEFRKRKLLQTTNLHTISKKAAKQR